MPINIIELLKSIRKGETMCASCDVTECPEEEKIRDVEMKSDKGLIILTTHCRAYSDRRKIER
jgi:hypothetical protein